MVFKRKLKQWWENQKGLALKVKSLGGIGVCNIRLNIKVCFRALLLGNNIENWEKYQSTRTKTKKAISEARSKMFEGFYQKLGAKNGEQQIYKLLRDRKGKQESWIK